MAEMPDLWSHCEHCLDCDLGDEQHPADPWYSGHPEPCEACQIVITDAPVPAARDGIR